MNEQDSDLVALGHHGSLPSVLANGSFDRAAGWRDCPPVVNPARLLHTAERPWTGNVRCRPTGTVKTGGAKGLDLFVPIDTEAQLEDSA
jgi:hypothetical protein